MNIYKKFTASLTLLVIFFTAVVPANADLWSSFREGYVLAEGASKTQVYQAKVGVDTSVSKDGYMLGPRVKFQHATGLAGKRVDTVASLSYMKGKLILDESEWGQRTGLIYLGKTITERERLAFDVRSTITLSPISAVYLAAGIMARKVEIAEDVMIFGSSANGTARSTVMQSYAELGYKRALPEHNALLTFSARIDNPIKWHEADTPITTSNGGGWSEKITLKGDFAKGTNWGSYGGHIAAIHEQGDWYPELGVRAEYRFDTVDFGIGEIRPAAFATLTADWEDGRNEKAIVGIAGTHKNGLSAFVGASYDSRREDQLQPVMGVNMSF